MSEELFCEFCGNRLTDKISCVTYVAPLDLIPERFESAAISTRVRRRE